MVKPFLILLGFSLNVPFTRPSSCFEVTLDSLLIPFLPSPRVSGMQINLYIKQGIK